MEVKDDLRNGIRSIASILGIKTDVFIDNLNSIGSLDKYGQNSLSRETAYLLSLHSQLTKLFENFNLFEQEVKKNQGGLFLMADAHAPIVPGSDFELLFRLGYLGSISQDEANPLNVSYSLGRGFLALLPVKKYVYLDRSLDKTENFSEFGPSIIPVSFGNLMNYNNTIILFGNSSNILNLGQKSFQMCYNSDLIFYAFGSPLAAIYSMIEQKFDSKKFFKNHRNEELIKK